MDLSSAPPGLTRLKLVLVLLVLLGTGVLWLASNSVALVVLQLLIDGPILLAWIGAGYGIGSLLLATLPRQTVPQATHPVLSAVTRIALGLGAMSLIALLLGMAGLLTRPVAIGLLVAANLPTILSLHRHQSALRSWLAGRAAAAQFILAPVMLFIASTLVAALVMPGILWGDEPHAYDVVAYHFQLPRDWLEGGRILATPHNVFGYFPLNVEMHYLLAMTVHGSAVEGMFLAQLMHAGMMFLTLAALYGALRDEAPESRARAAAGALLAAAFPWLMMLGSVGYNECGVMLYTTLALVWSLRRGWVVAGACAGFAAGCKITSLPTLVALLPAIVLVASMAKRSFAWRGVLIFAAVAMLVLSPWLIRTGLTTGNPLFPIGLRTLGQGHFDAGQVDRFEAAHAPRPDQKNLNARLVALNGQVLRDFKFGSIAAGSVGVPVLLLLIVPALVQRWRDGAAWLLLAFIVGNVLIWLFATHLQGRFLVPIIPAVALLVMRPTSGAWRWIVIAIGIGTTPLSYRIVAEKLFAGPAQSALGFGDPSVLLPEPLLKALQTNRPIYLVGDARAFFYPVPAARLHYRSVFDVPSGKPFREAWLGDAPRDALVIVLPGELARFERTYRNLPSMPPEWRGRPMFLTDVDLGSFTPLE